MKAGDPKVPAITDDFEWCPVTWLSESHKSIHVCAEHRPGHDHHICCCGERKFE